ncbi:hypothetical protein [Luteimonas notoginsengisoli]|jgi:uncharacterized phage infection (PIP) family protein YhgE|uniref:Methyl-accepting chemotaxis protein n=1 Tax=Luteimonas notoginsengisoli TaxID=1578200 RepID=A0ABV7UTF0_9GAMM
MAAWFTVVAPFLPDIIQMAKPMFTRDKGADKIPQQIKELQDAATQNADAVKQLAGEMQRTLASLQQGANQLETTLAALQQRNGELETELRRTHRLSLVAMTAALLAFALSAYALAA